MRTRIFTMVGLVMSVFLTAQAASAQTCMGAPTMLGNRTMNLTVGGAFPEGASTYSAGAVFGSEWLFGGAFSYTKADVGDASLKQIGADVAWQNQTEGGLAYCPMLDMSYGFGLEIGGVDASNIIMAPGLSLGYETQVSDAVSLVPTGSASLVYERVSIDGSDVSPSDSYGMLTAGVGVLFNDRFGVSPTVRIPVGVEGGDSDATFGLSLMVGVGN